MSAGRPGARVPDRRREGLVLIIVVFFTLLLTSAVATFVRRASVDKLVAGHRDDARRAEALARGGVELAKALLIEDRLREQQAGPGGEADGAFAVEHAWELWARAGRAALPVGDDARLRLRIRDAGSRLNLNALFQDGVLRDERSAALLEQLFERAILEMPGRPEDKRYDPRDLVRALVDWVDADTERGGQGGPEDEPYQRRDPPYRSADRPLLALDELRLVEGFDGPLVDALRPYATVHPWAGGDGINPNTAPPHVLGLLFYGVAEDMRLADAEQVKDLLDVREEGGIWCDETATHERCRSIREVFPQALYPPPAWTSQVFTVVSQATVGNVVRTVEAVVDRTELAAPVLVSWRVH